MLMALVERYILLRQTLGYKLRELSGSLRAFATFADGRSDTHVRTLYFLRGWPPAHLPLQTGVKGNATF